MAINGKAMIIAAHAVCHVRVYNGTKKEKKKIQCCIIEYSSDNRERWVIKR